jgi:hypothetical protein
MAGNLQSGIVYRGTLDCLARTFASDGLAGLYSGAKLEAVRCVPQVILMWFFIDKTKELLDRYW